jgi:predicted RNase H-like nuclease (RuvC/YqgF family)
MGPLGQKRMRELENCGCAVSKLAVQQIHEYRQQIERLKHIVQNRRDNYHENMAIAEDAERKMRDMAHHIEALKREIAELRSAGK